MPRRSRTPWARSARRRGFLAWIRRAEFACPAGRRLRSDRHRFPTRRRRAERPHRNNMNRGKQAGQPRTKKRMNYPTKRPHQDRSARQRMTNRARRRHQHHHHRLPRLRRHQHHHHRLPRLHHHHRLPRLHHHHRLPRLRRHQHHHRRHQHHRVLPASANEAGRRAEPLGPAAPPSARHTPLQASRAPCRRQVSTPWSLADLKTAPAARPPWQARTVCGLRPRPPPRPEQRSSKAYFRLKHRSPSRKGCTASTRTRISQDVLLDIDQPTIAAHNQQETQDETFTSPHRLTHAPR